MSALFLGEILYLFLDSGRWGLIICNGILLLLMATLFGVVFKIHGRFRQIHIYVSMCLTLIFCVNAGYTICSSYSEDIRRMESQYEDGTQLFVEGKIADIDEKTNSIYCYVKSAAISDGRQTMETEQIVLIIKRQDTGQNREQNVEKYGRKNDGTERLVPGRHIRAEVSFYKFAYARNEGGFDERKYYYSIGVSGKCVVTDYEVISRNHLPDKMAEMLYRVKQGMGRRIDCLTESHYSGIYKGILLGEKSAVPEETEDLYKRAGISHMLAISGLHISLIGYFIYRWLRTCRGIGFSAILSVGVICLYAMMIGGGFSTRRAVIMFGVNILADILGRTYDLLSALALAFIFIMVTNPFCVYHSGFLLSFGAILGINPLFEVVTDFLGTKSRWLKSWVAGICINVVSRPVIIYIYHEIPLYSSLINLVVISMMGIMVACGFAGLFISYVWFDFGKIIFLAGCRILEFYEFLCRQFLKLPNAAVIVKRPGKTGIVLYYLGIIFIIMILGCLRSKRRSMAGGKQEKEKSEQSHRQDRVIHKGKSGIKYMIAGIVNLMLFICLTHSGNDKLVIKMIDVGQGDSIYINAKGKNILIDAGSSSEKNITGYTILPFLKANGVRQLDYLVMTHSDSDHAGGMAELLNEKHNGEYYVKNLILPDIGTNIRDTLYKEIEGIAVENGINILYFSTGCGVKYRDVELKCIWPYQGADKPDKNNLSIVLLLESDNFKMLFTGDLSEDGEKGILSRQESLEMKIEDVDILKVGHHGSNGSGCREFVELLKPDVSVISCGRHNTYGHPGKQAIKRLVETGSDIFITTETGQITIFVNEKGFSVETFLH